MLVNIPTNFTAHDVLSFFKDHSPCHTYLPQYVSHVAPGPDAINAWFSPILEEGVKWFSPILGSIVVGSLEAASYCGLHPIGFFTRIFGHWLLASSAKPLVAHWLVNASGARNSAKVLEGLPVSFRPIQEQYALSFYSLFGWTILAAAAGLCYNYNKQESLIDNIKKDFKANLDSVSKGCVAIGLMTVEQTVMRFYPQYCLVTRCIHNYGNGYVRHPEMENIPELKSMSMMNAMELPLELPPEFQRHRPISILGRIKNWFSPIEKPSCMFSDGVVHMPTVPDNLGPSLYDTTRAKIEATVQTISDGFDWTTTWTKFIFKYGLVLLVLSLFVYVIYKLNFGRYRSLFTNQQAHLRPIQPIVVVVPPGALQVPGAPPPPPAQPLSNRFQDYPPHQQDVVKALLEEHEENNVKRTEIRRHKCPDCDFLFMDCLCVDNAGRPTAPCYMRVILSDLIARNRVIERALRRLWDSYDHAGVLRPGQVIRYNSRSNYILEFLSEFFVVKQPFFVSDSFYVQDTRPHSDRHIPISNTRVYVFEKLAPELWVNVFGTTWSLRLPHNWSHIENYDHRDLIVFEEHFRLIRRGAFEEPERVIRSQLENMLSIPLSDTSLRLNNVNALRDAFLILRAELGGALLPWEPFQSAQH